IQASRKGLLLQSWKEHFNSGVWKELISETGIDIYKYTGKLSANESVPWDVIRTDHERAYFAAELRAAYEASATTDCRDGCVSDCGACSGKATTVIKKHISQPAAEKFQVRQTVSHEPYHAVGLYEKTDAARFIPHRDMTRLIERAFRTAAVKLCYSQGFSAHADMSFTYPLSLGMTGLAERMTVVLGGPLPSGIIEKVNSALPDGVRLTKLTQVRKRISLEPLITDAEYRFELGSLFAKAQSALDEFMKSSDCNVSVRSKSGDKMTNIRPMVKSVTSADTAVIAVLSLRQAAFMRSSDFMKHALKLTDEEILTIKTERTTFLPAM
ncbi:MAG: DUF2344 domain-containing protein, partial [Fibrobacteres bacterium]|nr:DUF2344 domain-containing protein [Fibrobacterota bacterium]